MRDCDVTKAFIESANAGERPYYPHQGHQMTTAEKLIHDLEIILNEAQKHGTLNRLKDVAIYFHELELRTIVEGLKSLRPHDKLGN